MNPQQVIEIVRPPTRMEHAPKIVLVGEYCESVIAHQVIPKAVILAVKSLIHRWFEHSAELELHWVETTQVEAALADAAGIWVVPNSPYRSMEGALAAIRYSRENQVPFLGTCGGFQHAVIEYARNVLGIGDADHAETNPDGGTLVIAKLSCGLVNKSESIQIEGSSRLRRILRGIASH